MDSANPFLQVLLFQNQRLIFQSYELEVSEISSTVAGLEAIDLSDITTMRQNGKISQDIQNPEIICRDNAFPHLQIL